MNSLRVSVVGVIMFCISTAVSAQTPPMQDDHSRLKTFLFRLSAAAHIVAQAEDLAETEHCLGQGICHELNPYLARFDTPSRFAVAKFSLATGSVWLSAELFKTHPWWAIAANTGATIGYGYIAHRNAALVAAATHAPK